MTQPPDNNLCLDTARHVRLTIPSAEHWTLLLYKVQISVHNRSNSTELPVNRVLCRVENLLYRHRYKGILCGISILIPFGIKFVHETKTKMIQNATISHCHMFGRVHLKHANHAYRLLGNTNTVDGIIFACNVLKPCIEIIAHRNCWECGRCATWC